MDNIEFALMYGSDDVDGLFDESMPYIPSVNGDTIADILNDSSLQRMVRYHGAPTVGQGIINELRDRYPFANIREIKMKSHPKSTNERTTGVDGYPYVKVDFSWKSGSKELDPNDMDTKHIENSITYVKRLVDEGKKSELEGDRVIRGFKKILTARENADPIEENISETFKIINGMETPVISVFDKSTGEVVDLDNIPYAIILDLAKKYCS